MPDVLWAQIARVLPARKPHRFGGHNPRVPDRDAMEAILFVLRTGCQWNALNGTGLCSSSAAHRRFQEWTAAGVFQTLWRRALRRYDREFGLDWRWLAMDGAMTKAPLGGEKNGAEPYGPRQRRQQTQPADQRRRRPDRARDRRRQSQ